MDSEQLIAFDRVVREGSFSKAAWALNLSQPAISARIQALEKELGGELFSRGRKIALTERGISFLPYARRALAALDDGLKAANLAPQGERGRLALGSLRSLAGRFLGKPLTDFQKQYPQVECKIKEGSHWQMVDQLTDGLIELALICWPCIDPLVTNLTPLIIMQDPVILVAHPNHPLSQYSSISQEHVALESNPFLLLQWWQVCPMPIARLAARASNAAEVPTDIGRYLISEGVGAGFFVEAVVQNELERKEFTELSLSDMNPIYRGVAVVKLERQEKLSLPAQNFLGHLQKAAQTSMKQVEVLL